MNSSFFVLAALAAGAAVFTVGWFLLPQYFIASDPWRYSQAAFDILEHGEAGASTVFRHRLGLTLPVAFFYALFGVNVFATNVWMLICALLVIVIAWSASLDQKSKIISVGLALLCAPLWKFSTELYPDLVATAFMAASVLILTLRHERERKPAILAALGVFSLFVAFLAKESAYWVLPLWAWALLEDLRARTGRTFWLTSAAVGGLLGVGYLVCCALIWGDPLARLRAVDDFAGRHLWALAENDPELLYRITVQPPWFYLRTYGVLFVLALLGMITCPPRLRYWSAYLMMTIALFWVGSTSLSDYQPLPLMERMILPSLPAMLILSAAFVGRIVEQMPRLSIPAVFSAGVAAIMLLHSVSLVFTAAAAADPNETKAATFIRESVPATSTARMLVVTSDVRSAESLRFFFGYKEPSNLVLAKAVGFDASVDLNSLDTVYVYLNRSRSKYLHESYGSPHVDEGIEALRLPVSFAAGDIQVFSVPPERRAEFFAMLEREAKRVAG